MKKLFLSILTIVCLLATVTIINAIPVSADGIEDGEEPSLTITPPKPVKINEPILEVTVSLPKVIVDVADEGLSKADEVSPYLDYYSSASPN